MAPDNILLSDGQAPVLLDFGAARKAIEGTQVFTAILKPGYAPIEQYGDGDLKQGPWTDIYALAGSCTMPRRRTATDGHQPHPEGLDAASASAFTGGCPSAGWMRWRQRWR